MPHSRFGIEPLHIACRAKVLDLFRCHTFYSPVAAVEVVQEFNINATHPHKLFASI